MTEAPQPAETDRTLFTVTGADAATFLQGLITSDIKRAPTWAAMLSPQGKYLADFFVIPWNGGYLIDAPAAQGSGLMSRLGMYKLRSDVSLTPLSLTVVRGVGSQPDGAVADPRHPALGWRLYTPDAEANDTMSPDAWQALRVEYLVPEAGFELTPNDGFILEYGFDRLGGIDFSKGCYVGQEVTSRMHNKTTLAKGLTRILLTGGKAPAPGAEITGPDGRAAGRLGTVSGGRALAHLRFDRIVPGMTAGDARFDPDPTAPPFSNVQD